MFGQRGVSVDANEDQAFDHYVQNFGRDRALSKALEGYLVDHGADFRFGPQGVSQNQDDYLDDSELASAAVSRQVSGESAFMPSRQSSTASSIFSIQHTASHEDKPQRRALAAIIAMSAKPKFNKTILNCFVFLSCVAQAFLMIARVSGCDKNELNSLKHFSSCVNELDLLRKIGMALNIAVAFIVNCLSCSYYYKIATVIVFDVIASKLSEAKKKYSHVYTALMFAALTAACYPAYDYLVSKENELGSSNIKIMVVLFCSYNRIMISLYGFFLSPCIREKYAVIRNVTAGRNILAYSGPTPDEYILKGGIVGFMLSVSVLFALLNINNAPEKCQGFIAFYLLTVLLISIQSGSDVIGGVRGIVDKISLEWQQGKRLSSLSIAAIATACAWGAFVLADDLFNIIEINDDFHDFFFVPALALKIVMHASTTLITFSGSANFLKWFFAGTIGSLAPTPNTSLHQTSGLRASLLVGNGNSSAVPRYQDGEGCFNKCLASLFSFRKDTDSDVDVVSDYSNATTV
jgi:hypothetical protein